MGRSRNLKGVTRLNIGEDKDAVALDELRVIIGRLQQLTKEATKNVGVVRPILNSSEIDLIKDHLDLVKKYVAL